MLYLVSLVYSIHRSNDHINLAVALAGRLYQPVDNISRWITIIYRPVITEATDRYSGLYTPNKSVNWPDYPTRDRFYQPIAYPGSLITSASRWSHDLPSTCVLVGHSNGSVILRQKIISRGAINISISRSCPIFSPGRVIAGHHGTRSELRGNMKSLISEWLSLFSLQTVPRRMKFHTPNL